MTKRRHLTLALFSVLLPVILTGCLAPGATHDPALAARMDGILGRHADTGAIYTARIVELSTGRELYGHDIDTPFTPASNMKIPTAAAGLDVLGVDYTFKTYLAIDGDDLWVIGTGDPGFGDPRLAKRRGRKPTSVFDDWANTLAVRGVRHIAGDLVYYDGVLEDLWVHPSWGEDVLHWYGVGTSGLAFNDNCVDITIHPTVPGQAVRYDVVPPVQNIQVINNCVTGSRHAPTIEKRLGGNIYVLGGTCTKTAEMKSKPVDNPGAFLADALRTHLAARGITVAGTIRAADEPLDGTIPPAQGKIVAIHETSMPDVLGRINTNSQNMFSEALCKLTGQAYAAEKGRFVPGSWKDGGKAIKAFLKRNGINARRYACADGSGLSDDNKVTSRLLTDLFDVMYDRPDRDVWVDSLAKGGINGTLQKRFAGLDGHVFAKTGYIEGVRSLSGYVKTYDDVWLTFSIIYNRIPGSVKPYEKLQDEAVRLLVSWPNIEAE